MALLSAVMPKLSRTAAKAPAMAAGAAPVWSAMRTMRRFGLAVGEACSRAVEGHQMYCPTEPVRLALTDLADRFEVEVTDNCAADMVPAASDGPAGPAGRPSSATLAGGRAAAGQDNAGLDIGPSGFGLPTALGIAVIEGLADNVQISETSAGTSIRMSWPSAGAR